MFLLTCFLFSFCSWLSVKDSRSWVNPHLEFSVFLTEQNWTNYIAVQGRTGREGLKKQLWKDFYLSPRHIHLRWCNPVLAFHKNTKASKNIQAQLVLPHANINSSSSSRQKPDATALWYLHFLNFLAFTPAHSGSFLLRGKHKLLSFLL